MPPISDPSHRFAFTEARLRALENPAPGVKVRYRDATLPGLALRAVGQARAWIWYSKGANGRPVEIRLGSWPAISVEEARKQARTKIAPDPAAAQQAKRSRRQAQTVADAWKALLAHPWSERTGAPLRPATLASYRASWSLVERDLGARTRSDITAADVTALRDRLVAKHGPAQTRQALALLVLLIGGRMPRTDTGRAVQKPRLEPRRRFLDAVELGAILRGLEAEPPLWRVFWLCCLLAPLRRGNLARARWADLTLDHPPRWLVKAADAKGGKLLAMPIAEPLARVLRDWRERNRSEEWVFPRGLTAGPRKDAGPIVSVQHAWARALLLGEAVRLCDAIATAEGMAGRERFAVFLADLEAERLAAWNARPWKPRGKARASEEGPAATSALRVQGSETPMHRVLDRLRGRARALGIDPEPLALADATPHDLRRTAASWAVQSGASLAVVAASLGHADTRVTEAHYGHLSDAPVRGMLDANALRLLASVESRDHRDKRDKTPTAASPADPGPVIPSHMGSTRA